MSRDLLIEVWDGVWVDPWAVKAVTYNPRQRVLALTLALTDGVRWTVPVDTNGTDVLANVTQKVNTARANQPALNVATATAANSMVLPERAAAWGTAP